MNIQNAALTLQLRNAMASIEAIKTENLDALFIPNETPFKVYTEKTADKPYRILIEKMHEGAVTLNEDGTILYCNTYFATMVNLPLQKVMGSLFENFVVEPSKKHVKELLKLSPMQVLKEEVNLYAGYGKEIPVLMTVNDLLLDNISVLSIILTDLTIQKENQEKLRRRSIQLEQKNAELAFQNEELAFQIGEKEKMGAELSIAVTDVKELEGLNAHKENILATLSHDLRSPLAGIIGMAELLKENFESFENSTIKEMLDMLLKSSTDELNMLDYLVEWARIKYASEAFTPENIELIHYVKQAFDTLNENALARNIQLHNEIEEHINAFADGKMLLSILHNLISNSIKNTPAGGKITAIAKNQADRVVVEIKDTGVGMSKEVQEMLFIPQMISLSDVRQENKGAGIGLLLVKSFLKKNGGDIWTESIEGEGSSFYFTLPMREIKCDYL